MKRIFISGPISKGGIAANVRQADAAMLALMRAGLAVHNPMLTCYAGGQCGQYIDGTLVGMSVAPSAQAYGGFRAFTHSQWVASCLPWVEVADAVLRLPGESVGAELECQHAKARKVPVFTDLGALLTWAARDADPAGLGPDPVPCGACGGTGVAYPDHDDGSGLTCDACLGYGATPRPRGESP